MKNPEIIFHAYNGSGPGGEETEEMIALSERIKTMGLNHNVAPIRIIRVPIFAIEDGYLYIEMLKNGSITFEELGPELEAKFGESDAPYYYGFMEMAMRVAGRKGNPTEVIGDWSNSYGYSVGAKPLAMPNVEHVYNVFFGVTPTMETKGAYLAKLETDAYTKMISGETGSKTIAEYFDSFVQQYLSQGGQEISDEVQAEVDLSN